MARRSGDDPNFFIRSWLRNRSTLDFLTAWETERNEDFKTIEFDSFKSRSGRNDFYISVKEMEQFNLKAMYAKAGRYGGTYGHIVVAFHFANWLSPEFYHSFITSFIRSNAVSVKRLWSRLNYRLQTDSIKHHLPASSKAGKIAKYAEEADLLNVVVFGETVRQWKERNSGLKGNQRDHATRSQLHVLANLEALNAFLIRKRTRRENRVAALMLDADYQFDLFHAAYPKSK